MRLGDDPECNGQKMSCTDWEIGQSFRDWKRQYGDGWEAAFRHRYEREMIENTTPISLLVTCISPKDLDRYGLFYPPRKTMDDLFG
jgi:hypothetical protein